MQKSNHYAAKRDSLLIRIVATVLLLACTVMLLSQTVFAQNTYVIKDGDRVVVHTTYATDPAEVLDEAGLELDQDDTYTTLPGTGISEINVQRSQIVNIEYNGKQMQVATYGETVEALLNRLNISVKGNTQVSVALDAKTYDGMELTVSRTARSVETYTVPVAYDTVYQDDETLPVGKEKVLTEGVDGQKQCTASVLYENGEEISRVVMSETVTLEPVNQVVAVGTAASEQEERMPIGGPMPEIGDGIIILESGEVLTYTDTMQVVATGYNKSNEGCDDWTATGTLARVGAIAVDPRMIPYGTRMFIVSNDGAYVYGVATAEDCGGSIKGNRVDLYFDSNYECFQFGIRDCTIYILG
ncbi:MAG: G5 domain-containing protein [Oscillospiraceae bacterium]|nr:G5 domain-containing protein [Oscillospiraceae bacterium]